MNLPQLNSLSLKKRGQGFADHEAKESGRYYISSSRVRTVFDDSFGWRGRVLMGKGKGTQKAGHNQQGFGYLGTFKGLNVTDLGVNQELGVLLEALGNCSSQQAACRPKGCGRWKFPAILSRTPAIRSRLPREKRGSNFSSPTSSPSP